MKLASQFFKTTSLTECLCIITIMFQNIITLLQQALILPSLPTEILTLPPECADYYVYPSCGSHPEHKGGATPVGSGHCQFNEGGGGSFGATHPVIRSCQFLPSSVFAFL